MTLKREKGRKTTLLDSVRSSTSAQMRGPFSAQAKESQKCFLCFEKNKTLAARLFVREKNTEEASFKGPSQLFQRLTKAQCGDLERHQELQRGHATTSCAFVSAALSSSSPEECGPGEQRAVRPPPSAPSLIRTHIVTHCTVFFLDLHFKFVDVLLIGHNTVLAFLSRRNFS